MTHSSSTGATGPTAGTSLLNGRLRHCTASALAAVDALAAEVRAALPAAEATLISADTEAHAPAAFASPGSPAASSAEAPRLAPSAVITALAAGRTGTRTEVTARLADEHGAVALEARLAFLTDLPEPSGLLCPGSKPWTAELNSRLSGDAEFARLIETYDGTIGLSIGGREVHLRCYRGCLIEASARSILGADFVLAIPGAEFIELMQADHNTFMESAMMRRMSSSGSGYEYLRMTSALVRIIDIVRGIAVDAGYAGACADHVAGSTVNDSTAAGLTLEEV